MTIELKTDLINYPEDVPVTLGIWIDGCTRGCNGCFNQEHSQKKNLDDPKSCLRIIKDYLEAFKVKHIVILGGDPLDSQNLELTRRIIEEVEADICIYTGAGLKEIKEKLKPHKNLKYIKGGEYKPAFKVEPLRNRSGIQLATTNQFFLNSDFQIISKFGYLKFN